MIDMKIMRISLEIVKVNSTCLCSSPGSEDRVLAAPAFLEGYCDLGLKPESLRKPLLLHYDFYVQDRLLNEPHTKIRAGEGQ